MQEVICMKATVTTRGQVSIPSKIRKQFKIEPASKVEWEIEGNTIKIIPLPKDPITAFKGRGEGIYSTDKLLKERKKERRREDEEDRRR
jgi:AbrB family looped-hinge helix DNA binding protein